MARQLLDSALVDGLEALAVFNRPVFESHHQLVTILGQHLGARHAAVLAQPEMANGRISWWTDLPGTPHRWSELGAADRARLDPVRLQLGDEIARLAADLARAGINTPRGNLSQILAGALEVPGTEYLFIADDQPVLAFWGFRRIGGVGHNVFAPLQEPTVSAALPSAAPRRWRPWWLLSVLLAALLAAFLWWFVWPRSEVPPMAIPPIGAPRPVPSPPVTAPPVAPPPLEPPPEIPRSPAASPSVTPALPMPKPLAPSPDPLPAPVPGEKLALPQSTKDLKFLEGLWKSRTGLVWGNDKKNESVEMFYRMEGDGKGELLVRRPDGSYCRAPVVAQVGHGDGLSFHTLSRPRCPDGSEQTSVAVECSRLPDGAAACSGVNLPNGKKFAAELARADQLP